MNKRWEQQTNSTLIDIIEKATGVTVELEHEESENI